MYTSGYDKKVEIRTVSLDSGATCISTLKHEAALATLAIREGELEFLVTGTNTHDHPLRAFSSSPNGIVKLVSEQRVYAGTLGNSSLGSSMFARHPRRVKLRVPICLHGMLEYATKNVFVCHAPARVIGWR